VLKEVREGVAGKAKTISIGSPSTFGVRVGIWYRYKSEITKESEVRFRTVLGSGAAEVRFERATLS